MWDQAETDELQCGREITLSVIADGIRISSGLRNSTNYRMIVNLEHHDTGF
jgi:hypothetical protein